MENYHFDDLERLKNGHEFTVILGDMQKTSHKEEGVQQGHIFLWRIHFFVLHVDRCARTNLKNKQKQRGQFL
jgi:hypothetical protein